jgi:hypothetical protein
MQVARRQCIRIQQRVNRTAANVSLTISQDRVLIAAGFLKVLRINKKAHLFVDKTNHTENSYFHVPAVDAGRLWLRCNIMNTYASSDRPWFSRPNMTST